MVFGLLKDIKKGEYRTIATPVEIAALARSGHRCLVQRGAGAGAGFPDSAYAAASAELRDTAAEIFAEADLVAKVKELEPPEYPLLREGQIVFTCLHPAANPEEVQALLRSRCIAFTAEDSHRHGSPNCEAAGKQGALFGLESMLTIHGGKGKFVSGLAGAPAMNVLILGTGLVARSALGVLQNLGARCTVAGRNLGTMRSISALYRGHVSTVTCSRPAIEQLLPTTDMILNCIKWPKEQRGYLIDRAMLRKMEPGSVIVDISCDPHGPIETCHETTHEDPRYIEEGIVHFCVSNIPGAIAQSASVSYAASVLPHLQALLDLGVREACIRDGFLRRSMTVYRGVLTHEETSAVQNIPWLRPRDALGIAGEKLDPAPPATPTRSRNCAAVPAAQA